MGNSYFNTSLELSKEDEDQHSFQVEKNNDSFGERFEIPKAYGHGVLERYAIRPDLILSIVQHETLKEAIRGNPVRKKDSVMMSFYLSGEGMKSVGEGIKGCFITGSGDSYLYNPYSEGEWMIPAGEKLVAVSVTMSLNLLESLVRDYSDVKDKTLVSLIEDSSCPYYHKEKINPHIRVLLTEITGCALQGGLKRIYLEGKVLSLIAQRLAERVEEKEYGMAKSLSRKDIEKLEYAKELLINNMTTPPSLDALARECQINSTKLKAGFKQYFGNTVYGYLKEKRLIYAKNMLVDKKVSVSDAAFYSGYMDTSHFISIFKERYHVHPGSLLS